MAVSGENSFFVLYFFFSWPDIQFFVLLIDFDKVSKRSINKEHLFELGQLDSAEKYFKNEVYTFGNVIVAFVRNSPICFFNIF